MQTEQPAHGNLVSVGQQQSQTVQRKLIHTLCRVASAWHAQGWYARAEPFYLCALALAEKVCGDEEVGVICKNLAALYQYMDRFTEAEQMYRRTLLLMEQSPEPEDPEIAMLFHNLSSL